MLTAADRDRIRQHDIEVARFIDKLNYKRNLGFVEFTGFKSIGITTELPENYLSGSLQVITDQRGREK